MALFSLSKNFCSKNNIKRPHINNCMNVYHTAELNKRCCISTNGMRQERNFTRFHWVAILVTETSFLNLAGSSVSRLEIFSELFLPLRSLHISVKYGKGYGDVNHLYYNSQCIHRYFYMLASVVKGNLVCCRLYNYEKLNSTTQISHFRLLDEYLLATFCVRCSLIT